MKLTAESRFFYHNEGNRSWMIVMRIAKAWRRMVAWAKPIDEEVAGLLVILEDE